MSIERKKYSATGWKSWVERRPVNTVNGMVLSYVRLIKLESDHREVTLAELTKREGIADSVLRYRIANSMPMPALLNSAARHLPYRVVQVAWRLNGIYKQIQRDGVISRDDAMAIHGGNNTRHINILKNLKICFSQFKTFKYGPAVIYFFDEDHPAVAAAIHAIKTNPAKRKQRLPVAPFTQPEKMTVCCEQTQLMLNKLAEKGWFSKAEIVGELGMKPSRWKSRILSARKVCDIASISTGQNKGGWLYYVPGDERYIAELDRLAKLQRSERQAKMAEEERQRLAQRAIDREQREAQREAPRVITDQLRQNTLMIARAATAKKDPVNSWLYGSAKRA